jgi:hypothetical protein
MVIKLKLIEGEAVLIAQDAAHSRAQRHCQLVDCRGRWHVGHDLGAKDLDRAVDKQLTRCHNRPRS